MRRRIKQSSTANRSDQVSLASRRDDGPDL